MSCYSIPVLLLRAATLAFCLLLTGCQPVRGGPPQITLDRTPCSQCGMLISELSFASAYQFGAGDPKTFDDVGCMIRALQKNPPESEASVWFCDFITRDWTNGNRAFFVVTSDINTPMGSGIVSFSNLDAAERLVRQRGGAVVRSFRELLRHMRRDETE